MVVAKDVKWRTVLGVQKACRAYVSHMVEGVDANILLALREPKEAQCSAKLMVEENDALLKGVLKVLREVHLFARVMVEGKGALS